MKHLGCYDWDVAYPPMDHVLGAWSSLQILGGETLKRWGPSGMSLGQLEACLRNGLWDPSLSL
jgi:hypothetical protein